MYSSTFQLDKLLARTAAAAAVVAGFGLMAVPQQAQAVIIYSGPVNLNVPSTTAGIYLNVVTGVSGITPAAAPGWDLNPWGSGSLFVYANNSASVNDGAVASNGTTTQVDNLPIGYVVDGTSGYVRTGAAETAGAFGFLVSSSSNYIGFRFLDESDSTLKFGWAHFSLGTTGGAQPRTLIEYAYESTGASIRVGAVPEPSAFALMSLGGMGLVALGRRRQQRAAAALS
jgi:hypothetical protein